MVASRKQSNEHCDCHFLMTGATVRIRDKNNVAYNPFGLKNRETKPQSSLSVGAVAIRRTAEADFSNRIAGGILAGVHGAASCSAVAQFRIVSE